jgi:hypothetical protein
MTTANTNVLTKEKVGIYTADSLAIKGLQQKFEGKKIKSKYENRTIINSEPINGPMWAFDETFLGEKGVFMIISIPSNCIKGFVISKKPNFLRAEHIMELMDILLEQVQECNGNFPVYLHEDDAPLYKSKGFQDYVKKRELVFSCSVGVKHGNQVCESYNNRLKQQVAYNCFEEKSLTQSKKKILSQLSYSQKKMNSNRKSKNAKVRDILFQTEFFLATADENIKRAIEQINQNKHTLYTRFKRQELEFYIENVLEHTGDLVGFDMSPTKKIKRQLENEITFGNAKKAYAKIANLPT